MAKVSFRIALASRESVFDVQTSTTRSRNTRPMKCPMRGGQPATPHGARLHARASAPAANSAVREGVSQYDHIELVSRTRG